MLCGFAFVLAAARVKFGGRIWRTRAYEVTRKEVNTNRNAGRRRNGGRGKDRGFVSQRLSQDTDLNINSQRPYTALIIDYQ